MFHSPRPCPRSIIFRTFAFSHQHRLDHPPSDILSPSLVSLDLGNYKETVRHTVFTPLKPNRICITFVRARESARHNVLIPFPPHSVSYPILRNPIATSLFRMFVSLIPALPFLNYIIHFIHSSNPSSAHLILFPMNSVAYHCCFYRHVDP